MEYNIRYHEKCCFTCRYYRLTKTGSYTSCCLFFGRDLGISNSSSELAYLDRARLCEGWKKRPKTWAIFSNIFSKDNPFWHDPYIPRETQQRLDGRRNTIKEKQ